VRLTILQKTFSILQDSRGGRRIINNSWPEGDALQPVTGLQKDLTGFAGCYQINGIGILDMRLIRISSVCPGTCMPSVVIPDTDPASRFQPPDFLKPSAIH
jgi:hypothetical protein